LNCYLLYAEAGSQADGGKEEEAKSSDENNIKMAPSRRMSLPYDQRISPLRMQQLKCSLIKWALSEVKRQEDEAAAKREEALAERIPAFPDLDSLDEEALKQLCRDLHGMCDKCDDNKYDLETKHAKQETEIQELMKRIQDVKGLFTLFALKYN